jgi:hypothetical protein
MIFGRVIKFRIFAATIKSFHESQCFPEIVNLKDLTMFF